MLAAIAFTAVAPPAAWADDVPSPAPSSPTAGSGVAGARDALDALASLRHASADDETTAGDAPVPETDPPADGDGTTDAGTTDAGATDAGATDAGATDAGATDDSTNQPGTEQGGTTETGTGETGTDETDVETDGDAQNDATPTPEPTESSAPPVLTPTPTPTPTPTVVPSHPATPTPSTPTPSTPPRVPSPPLGIHDAPGDYPTPQHAYDQALADEAAAASARAEAEAAARASAARVAAFTAAQAEFTRASAAYDTAKLAYASTKARYDEATARATLVHGMATDAAETAARAGRVVATITRAMAQQRSGTATVDAFLEGAGGDLLYRLGTLDKLSHLSGSLAAIKQRSVVEQQRADTLVGQDRAAQEAVLAIPLDQARSDMDTAKAGFDAAKARLDSLRRTSTAGVLGMSPLPAHRPDTGQLSAQGWFLPAVGSITDHFGPRPDRPLPDVGDFHYGTDIGAACDAGVYAATSGTVVSAGALGTYGNWVLIDHGNGVQTGYAHLATGEMLVSVGDTVVAGQVIAGVGSTGASTGCHLHFEVRIDGSRVDPQPFMAKRGVVLGR